MLADRPIHTALPATDLERARRFYAEKLGSPQRANCPMYAMGCSTVVVEALDFCYSPLPILPAEPTHR